MENTITNKSKFRLNATTLDTLVYSIGLVCMLLFLSSAYSKIREHQTFYNGLAKVEIIAAYAQTIAWFVPLAELMICVLLIIPKTQKTGLYGFTALMLVFTIYIGSMWLWAEKLPCHCNLIIDHLSWGAHIWFNLGFIALGICGICLSKKIKS